jgi:S-adenosylmethionine:tRNA ribosyltransferase-isomerase
MLTSAFNYVLPPELIAQEPAAQRDAARLLVVRRAAGTLEHRRFADLPDLLAPGDLLVLNDTRVLPARLLGRKPTGGKIELLLLEECADGTWEALLRTGSKRPPLGTTLELAGGARATLLTAGEKGRVTLRFASPLPILDLLEQHGLPPLPPYIKRDKRAETRDEARDSVIHHPPSTNPPVSSDRARYQTVYARAAGAIAAPTAGLHFTPELFQTLERRGIGRAFVTLHVGIGTFRPVTAERAEDHQMEAERYTLPPETAAQMAVTRRAGGRIVAVGSTSTRTLETVAAEHDGAACAATGRTALFILPPYRFRAVDALITNFHLPQSTLLMLVSAFAGAELIRRAYTEAIRERYRFFSYGDAMLIL